MDPIVGRFITDVKKTLEEHAEDSMVFPKSEPFDHGRQVGVYQGLRLALDHLENILRDNTEKEQRS